MNETQCCGSVRKSTEMESIIKQMYENSLRVSLAHERISEYLSRQLGPCPTNSKTEKYDLEGDHEPYGNIESMKRILEREKDALNFIHDMLDSLEQIG